MSEWYPGKFLGQLAGKKFVRGQEIEFPFKKGSQICGRELEQWLMDKGLSLLDARDIIIGIPDFKSTTIALDTHGKIKDYDEYYEDAAYVMNKYNEVIKHRLRQLRRLGISRLIYFNNIPPNCLEYYKSVPI